MDRIKVKVDTGARSSSLHAFGLKKIKRGGVSWVRFQVHPVQQDFDEVVECEAPVFDQRRVSDSGGHRELRYLIRTVFWIGLQRWPIELTLTNRSDMRFRMLLGRVALSHRFIVDVSHSYLQGKPGAARKVRP